MHPPRNSVAWLAWFVVATPAMAQQNPVVVQLPTFSSFRVLTTVSVPDRGGAYLGGIGSGRVARSRFGTPFKPAATGFGGGARAAGLHVSAMVHDHHVMDAALLHGNSPEPPQDSLARQIRNAQTDAAGRPAVAGVEQLRARHAAVEQSQQAEAREYLKRAAEAQAAGKPGVARIHLHMAARRATGHLKQEIAARLQTLR